MLYSENGFKDRDSEYAKQYGEEKLFADLNKYTDIIGVDWMTIYNERLPYGSLEDLHIEALKLTTA